MSNINQCKFLDNSVAGHVFNHRYYNVIAILVLVILSSCKLTGKSDADENSLPNILLIYTDQQRYNTIHVLGNEFIETPNFAGHPEDGRSADRAMAWKTEDDPMHILTDSTIQLLASFKDTGSCFIWLSYLYPHTPYMLPEPFFSMYDSVEIPTPIVEPEGLERANKPFRQVFHQENNDRLIPYNEEKIKRMK